MAIRYKIFDYAKKKGFSKTDLKNATQISTATLAKLSKDEMVSLDVIDRICNVLGCQPGEILYYDRDSNNVVFNRLFEEMQLNLKGGIYHRTQVLLAYNSNHIEGNTLTEDQTQYIFETNTIGIEKDMESVNIDDIVETINHFSAFKYILAHAMEPLSEGMIKEVHKILKSNTSDSRKEWFNVGDYKSRVNAVGDIMTVKPKEVATKMSELITTYNNTEEKTERDLIKFHYDFECIHPFQDGNGRVGRLIIFKECLKNNLIPIIILDRFKEFYYRGLKMYSTEEGFLTDTCLHGQDFYKALLEQFEVC